MFQTDLFDGEELYALAKLDLQKGQVAEGLYKLKLATGHSSCPIEADLELARVFAQLGLRKKAAPLFARYLEHRRDDVDARFQHGMVLFEEGLTTAAVTLWEQVLDTIPDYPPALFYRAYAVVGLGDASRARSLLKAALEQIAPDNLYFTRSRDLLSALDSGGPASPPLDLGHTYRTQH